ncbi:MAG: phosphodiester glycosidase family protein, partial [Erythrobacter sp.]|nr:phosphodiester glycosidase family protein [Erythrobacter sp.]
PNDSAAFEMTKWALPASSTPTAFLTVRDGPGNFHMKPNGVFFGSDGTWRVLTADRFYSTVRDRPRFGTQSGPMLVINGELHPDIQDNGPSRTVRNAVGVDDAGKAHFVISNAALSFGQIARFYRDELKVKDALFLDGNVSSLWDPATDRLDRGLIGPMIVVTNRESAGG